MGGTNEPVYNHMLVSITADFHRRSLAQSHIVYDHCLYGHPLAKSSCMEVQYEAQYMDQYFGQFSEMRGNENQKVRKANRIKSNSGVKFAQG